MSTTLCRGCGQPLGASQEVCLNCGIRNVLPGAATTEPVGATVPAAAASAVLESPPTPVAPMPEADDRKRVHAMRRIIDRLRRIYSTPIR